MKKNFFLPIEHSPHDIKSLQSNATKAKKVEKTLSKDELAYSLYNNRQKCFDQNHHQHEEERRKKLFLPNRNNAMICSTKKKEEPYTRLRNHSLP